MVYSEKRREAKHDMSMDVGDHLILKHATIDEREAGHAIPGGGDVPEPPRVRRGAADPYQIDRFLLESQLVYVLPCAVVFWIVLLLIS